MRDAEEFEYVFPCLRHRNYWSHGVGAVPMSVLSVGFIVVVLYCRRALLSSCFTVVVLYCRWLCCLWVSFAHVFVDERDCRLLN